MTDENKSKAQLIAELTSLRRQIADLEVAEAKRRETQAILAISHDILQRLVQQLPIGVEIFDTQGFTIGLNDALIKIFGITAPERVIGHFNLFEDEMAAQTGTQAAGYQALAGQTVYLPEVLFDYSQSDPRFAQAQGYKYLAVTFFPVRNAKGEIIQIVALNEDITKRKQFEFELARFRTIMDQAGEAIFVMDAQSSQIIDVNETACRYLGYTREELLQLTAGDIESSRSLKSSTQWATRVETIKQAGAPFFSQERHRRKDGTTFPVEILLSFQSFEGNDYIVAVIRDVTVQARLEEQLRQSQKMEAVGQLAGGVAHNFNNLLTAIMGYISLSLAALPANHPVACDLQEVQKAAERAANLTQQLLTFTRKQIIQPKVFNINKLVVNIHTMLRQLISEAIDLVTISAPDLGEVEIDPGQIEQVLMNLVVNARDAMPDGGKLTIETANITLDQSYTSQHAEVSPGEYVMLAVSDTGHGITEEVKAHIFEPFFTTKEVGQGTGLGLATCFGIVKQNNGHISVYSEVGQGTTFKVYLPRIAGTPDSMADTNEAEKLSSGAETILVVEDEIMVRTLVARTLRQQGYMVIEATNGQQALQIIAESSEPAIQLLVTDVIMPGIGGNTLANRLKVIYPDIKVLFISGYTDNAIVHHGVLEPGINFLPKPFTPGVLTLKVREVLNSNKFE